MFGCDVSNRRKKADLVMGRLWGAAGLVAFWLVAASTECPARGQERAVIDLFRLGATWVALMCFVGLGLRQSWVVLRKIGFRNFEVFQLARRFCLL